MLELLTFWRAVGLVAVALLIRFFQRLHFHRSLMKGLPGPPHSYLFGSLLSVGKVMVTRPSNAAPQTLLPAIRDYYDLPDVYYFDPWPMGPPVMAISNLKLYQEFVIKHSIPKHPLVAEFMENFGGQSNLVSSEGATWKRWRSVFNPGFSNSHIMSQVSSIVDVAQTFCEIMNDHAKNNTIFRMETATTKLTVDVIGKIVLDLDLNSQKGDNILADTFTSQVRWQSMGAQYQPSELWDIRRPIVQRYNNWVMSRYLKEKVQERFATREGRGKSKHVVDLALEVYLKEVKGTNSDGGNIKSLDAEFMEAVIANMKTFVFAGHDTTSTVIGCAYYYLSRNPEALTKLRNELDEVFGPDPSTVAQQLKDDPLLLNKMDYAVAVCKETLRLMPPASTVRAAAPGYRLIDPDTGEHIPTEHMLVWPSATGIHRHPKYFPDPHTFKPSRFLPGDDTGSNTAAWIPFSKGPRNCIGQELAMIEAKIVLAMTVRTWDFVPAYDELEKLEGDGTGYPNLKTGILEQYGERMYQIQLGTAKPAEGLPCRLRFTGQ
ncbi:unnamed protein product [Zymoseptoria tritici ST99CH_3D1]|nr:unnamed protein product [Zymoseptoria tritici ST99CH_3D1]